MASQDLGLRELDEDLYTIQSLNVADPGTPLYTALPGYMHIRLLSLASESVLDHAILHCNFIVQDIRKVVPWAGYNALSYVWGSSPERVPIICNDHELSITRNLYNALLQIWKVTPRQLLWADAICINQKDNVEKALQVGIMGEIYKAATTVLVWLGDEEDSIADSWDVVQEKPKELGDLKKIAFDNLLAHPWFTRAWTLQEVLLARKAVLLCGTRWIDWRLLTETIGPRGPLEALRRCTEIIQSDQNRESRNLFKELLIATSVRDAADPRDKVYSLLGLLTQRSVRIRPDYTISYWQLIANFVRDQVQTHADVWFLHACETGLKLSREFDSLGFEDSLGQRPSWLPDLLNPRILKLVSERHIFPTLSGAYLDDSIRQRGDGILRVSGIPIGTFTHVGEWHDDGWSITPLPKCIVEALSRGINTGSVGLLFKGSLGSLLGHSLRYLDHIRFKLSESKLIKESFDSLKFYEDQAKHEQRQCSCSQDNWSSFWDLNRAKEHGPCPMSRKSFHHNIRSGDLLCVLADRDGCFALRQPLNREGVFRLVGSAFAPILGRAPVSTGVAFQWPVPSDSLLIDLC